MDRRTLAFTAAFAASFDTIIVVIIPINIQVADFVVEVDSADGVL